MPNRLGTGWTKNTEYIKTNYNRRLPSSLLIVVVMHLAESPAISAGPTSNSGISVVDWLESGGQEELGGGVNM